MARAKIFVAGIHGSGKGTICHFLQEKFYGDYISASKLLQWNTKSKLVEDVDDNQVLLLKLLQTHLIHDFLYVIDGHFVLWDNEEQCKKVSDSFFETLRPDAIILAFCDPLIIKERLFRRDNISYSIEKVNELQEKELEHAHHVSDMLNVPLLVVDSSEEINISSLTKFVDPIMRKYTRNNIYSEMLKTVIMRLDFSGATDLNSIVDKIKRLDCVQKAFGAMHTFDKQNYTVNLRPNNPNGGELPFSQLQHSTVYRFQDYKLHKECSARLDIDDDSLVLVVDCNEHYPGSTEFTDLFIELMCEIRKHDQYIAFERLGVRKIDIHVLGEEEKISEYFNEHFVVSQSWSNLPAKKMSSLTELLTLDDVNFNIVQRIDNVNANQKVQTRLIFDIDSYIEGATLSKAIKEDCIKYYLHGKMQDQMFDMFVNVASTSYLEKCYEDKAKLNG